MARIQAAAWPPAALDAAAALGLDGMVVTAVAAATATATAPLTFTALALGCAASSPPTAGRRSRP